MANVTLDTLLTKVSQYLGDASVGSTTEQARKINAINDAKDLILSSVGLPASEVTYSFSFTDDVWVYALPAGYVDKINVRYDETKGVNQNNQRANSKRKFEYVNPDEFYALQYKQNYSIVFWTVDYVNGAASLLVNTRNIVSSLVVDSCDQTTDWTLSGDGTGLAVDSNVFTEGNGSLTFNINSKTNGFTTLTKDLSSNPQDWTNYLSIGVFTFDWYVEGITGLTSISVNYGTDASNYWTVSVTTDKSGNAFAVGWVHLSLSWANATMVGAPDVTSIKTFWITQNYSTSTFVTSTNWRIDNINLHSPDSMLFTYYTDQVVTTAGGVKQKDFVSTTDVASFLSIDASIANTLCSWAAMMYRPTALDENNTWLQQMATTGLKSLQTRFPKKVVMYLGRMRYDRGRA